MTRSTSLLARVRRLMRHEADRRAAEQSERAGAEPAAVAPRSPAAEHDAPDLEMLEAEARHRRFRLALYEARIYAGKPTSIARLKELQRSSAGADARVKRARGRRRA